MKLRSIFSVALLALSLSAQAQGWHNPMILGNQEGMGHGDPYVLKYRGVYYLYSSSHELPRCWTSRDLIHWTDAVVISDDRITMGAYAPEVIYWNGKFYMCTSPYGNGHYILTSDSPLGPFRRVTENMGRVIDGSFFVDDDGSWYFYHADGNGIRGCQMPTHSSFGPDVEVGCTMLGQWTEGPGVFKRNGYYYMFYTGNHVVTNGYRIDYAISNNGPIGRYTMQSEQNPILVDAETSDHYGLGHGSAFVGPDLDSYYFCYHNLVRNTGFLGPGGNCYRLYNFDRMAWNGDKMMILGPTTWEQDAPAIADNDYFDRQEIGDAWQLDGDSWAIVNADYLEQSNPDGRHQAILTPYRHDDYTAEFTVKMAEGETAGTFGAVYNYTDKNNYCEAIIDVAENKFTVRDIADGQIDSSASYALPADFNPYAWHSIRVEKNAKIVSVYIDNMRKVRRRIGAEGGQVGYASDGCMAHFSYIAISPHVSGTGILGVSMPIPSLFAAQHFAESSDGVKRSSQTMSVGQFQVVKLSPAGWLAYNVNVEKSYVYNIGLRYKSTTESRVRLYVDDVIVADNVVLPKQVTWGVQTIRDVEIPGGHHSLKIECVEGSPTLYEFNIRRGVLEPTVLSDDFSDGISSDWGYVNGDWSWQDGQARAGGYGKMLLGTAENGYLTDYTVECDVEYLNSPNAGIIFRVTNPSTGGANDNPVLGTDFLQGYFFGVGYNSCILGRHNFGWQTLVTANGTFLANNKAHLKVEVEGATMRCYVDGALMITYTDPVPFIEGRAGLRTHNCSALFDNFVVTPKSPDTSITAPAHLTKTADAAKIYNAAGQLVLSNATPADFNSLPKGLFVVDSGTERHKILRR